MNFTAESPFIALHRPLRVAYACVKPAIWISLIAMITWVLAVAVLSMMHAASLEPLFLMQLGTGYAIVLMLSIALYIWFSKVAYHQAGYWVHERYGLHLTHTQVLLLLTGWYNHVSEPGQYGDEYGTIAHDGMVLVLVVKDERCQIMHLNAPEGACELRYQKHECSSR